MLLPVNVAVRRGNLIDTVLKVLPNSTDVMMLARTKPVKPGPWLEASTNAALSITSVLVPVG